MHPGLEVALHREVLNAGTETGCERAGIKLSDRCRTASSGANAFPTRFDVQSQRRDRSQTGDNDPAAFHDATLLPRWVC